MQRLIKEYGNESIYLNYGTGTLGGTMTRSWPPGNTLVARLMNCCGGYLNHYGDYSSAQIAEGLNYTDGGWADGKSIPNADSRDKGFTLALSLKKASDGKWINPAVYPFNGEWVG